MIIAKFECEQSLLVKAFIEICLFLVRPFIGRLDGCFSIVGSILLIYYFYIAAMYFLIISVLLLRKSIPTAMRDINLQFLMSLILMLA